MYSLLPSSAHLYITQSLYGMTVNSHIQDRVMDQVIGGNLPTLYQLYTRP